MPRFHLPALPRHAARPRNPARPPSRLRASVLGLTLLACALVLGPVAAPQVARAQSPFAAAVYVNDAAITHYEIDQRRRFLEFIGAGGPDPRARALERLIEERLQEQEARRLGIRLGPDQLTEAMREFAARGELSIDEFMSRMRDAAIERDTFVNFIRVGVLWRELVQARFGPQIRVTPAQVEQALSVANVRPQTEILISEIFLPSDPRFAEIVGPLVPRILAIDTIAEFAEAARGVSATESGERGGEVPNWIPLATLPEALSAQLAAAPLNRVIGPIEVPGAIGFFMIRGRRDLRDVPSGRTELEYRHVALPGGRSETNIARAASIRNAVRACPDFGAAVGRAAPELPPEAVQTTTRMLPDLPSGLATELARLNPGQVSANLVEGGELIVVMLCARRLIPDPRPPREAVEQALLNRALEARAEVYLQTLRAEAEIRRN